VPIVSGVYIFKSRSSPVYLSSHSDDGQHQRRSSRNWIILLHANLWYDRAGGEPLTLARDRTATNAAYPVQPISRYEVSTARIWPYQRGRSPGKPRGNINQYTRPPIAAQAARHPTAWRENSPPVASAQCSGYRVQMPAKHQPRG
jgi:hypothetical protein